LKILTFTTLFPNAVNPGHGIFVENRLRHLIGSGEVESKVVAPVPWFPFKNEKFGEYADKARIPAVENRNGIEVLHPRYPLIPKIGMSLAPCLIALSVFPLLKRVIKNGYDFEVLDAHYFYPDGVAAVLLGKWLNKPVVITARGTDLNLIPQYLIPRRMIVWAARQAKELITVCHALKEVLLQLGIPDEKITVIRNGVDLGVFQPPENRIHLREKLNIIGKSVLSVGYLIERKGHHLIIEALKQLPDVKLYIAGDGGDRGYLEKLSKKHGVEDRVIFLGRIRHEELAEYYGAVDMLVLASSREGWANVLLESMACGTPVVATKIWGTPEIVTVPEAGILCDRTIDGIAQAIMGIYCNYPDRAATRYYAENFSWEDVTRKQITVFNNIINE